MKSVSYIIMNEIVDTLEAFKKFEDNTIALKYNYSKLTLKKPPKELPLLLSLLKKHISNPLKGIVYNNGTKGEGGMNIAMYSESNDSILFNLTNIKKLKFGVGLPSTNIQADLEDAKKSLSKWIEWKSKASKQSDIKKARGSISRINQRIIKLEDMIRTNKQPLAFSSLSYTTNKNEALETTILHELGHRIRNKFNTSELNVLFIKKDFPTEYSKRNFSEYFSEVYALVKMNLIDKTPMSDNGKRLVKKIIKE